MLAKILAVTICIVFALVSFAADNVLPGLGGKALTMGITLLFFGAIAASSRNETTKSVSIGMFIAAGISLIIFVACAI